MPIINPFNPNQENPEDQTSILTPQNIKTPQEMVAYMLSDMKQLVFGFEQTRANQILMSAKMNKLGSMVVKVMEENVRFRKAFLSQGIEIEEVIEPDLPEQTKEVLAEYERRRNEEEQHAFPPHPNHVKEENV